MHNPFSIHMIFLSILAAFDSPLPTHLEVRKWILTIRWLVLLHCLFWKPGFKYFKAFSTLSTSSWLSLVMDKPPQLFVAGFSKLGSIVYLHWKWKVWRRKDHLSLTLVITPLLLPQDSPEHHSRESNSTGTIVTNIRSNMAEQYLDLV